MILNTILISLMLSACTPASPDGQNPAGPGGTVDTGRTDAEMFNSMILKSDIEGLPAGAYLTGAEDTQFETVLTFSNEQKMYIGKHYGAYVAQDADEFITINGNPSKHKVIECPYYTLSEDGYWVNQGEKTTDLAIPREPKEADKPAVPYLRYMRDAKKATTAYFSDGSSIVLNKPAPVYKMYVKKNTSQMDVYIGEADGTSYIKYPFKKRNRIYEEGKYPSYLDNWGIGALVLCEKTGDSFSSGIDLFLNGEAELAIQVTDGKDPSKNNYVGGTLHGFENITYLNGERQLTITVDGKSIKEGDSINLMEADKIVMTQDSEMCQAYTNSNPFAKAHRIWTFENGRLSVEIEVTFLRDMYINQAMFGMLCVLRRWQGNTSQPYLTCYAIKDNKPLEVINVADGWGSMSKDRGTTKITQYGEKGWSFALAFDDGTYKEKGGMFVGTNGNAYNKIYLDLTGKYNAVAGEVLKGKVHWEIESTRY